MNYFDPAGAAERYATGRPDFHANTIAHIRAFLQPTEQLKKALDIACGTGLSTKALLELAEEVYGTDASETMLAHALRKESIHYSVAFAETQPFPDREFDLITVSSGVHWFDIDRFLTEANRLLKSRSWLVIYDNFFLSEMEGNEAFSRWYPEVFLQRFPAPKRADHYGWTAAQLSRLHFTLVHEEQFRNPVAYTKAALVLYLTTQSNVTAAVESGQTDYAATEHWLHEALTPFFTENEEQVLYFGNWIKFLRRND